MGSIDVNDVLALADAYGASSMSTNLFERAVFNLALDRALDGHGPDVFEADGELYVCFDNAILTAQSLNPFECEWSPSVTFTDSGIDMMLSEM